jgi:hypothetical protein
MTRQGDLQLRRAARWRHRHPSKQGYACGRYLVNNGSLGSMRCGVHVTPVNGVPMREAAAGQRTQGTVHSRTLRRLSGVSDALRGVHHPGKRGSVSGAAWCRIKSTSAEGRSTESVVDDAEQGVFAGQGSVRGSACGELGSCEHVQTVQTAVTMPTCT